MDKSSTPSRKASVSVGLLPPTTLVLSQTRREQLNIVAGAKLAAMDAVLAIRLCPASGAPAVGHRGIAAKRIFCERSTAPARLCPSHPESVNRRLIGN